MKKVIALGITFATLVTISARNAAADILLLQTPLTLTFGAQADSTSVYSMYFPHEIEDVVAYSAETGVSKFDPSLGTLTAVELKVHLQIDGTGRAEMAQYYTGGHGGVYVSVTANAITPNLYGGAATSAEFIWDDVLGNPAFETQPLEASTTGNIGANLADVTGTGSIDLGIDVYASADAQDDLEEFVTSDYLYLAGTITGYLEAKYTYDPAPISPNMLVTAVAVPEPASLGVLTTCMLLLLTKRKRYA